MKEVIVVSHGFQSHYEAGFTNGLARNGVKVHLMSSDKTLYDKLHPNVVAVNVRGSQDPSRPKWRKVLNMLAYHGRLVRYCMGHRGVPVMVIGLQEPEVLVGVLEAWMLRWLSGRLYLTVHNILPHDKHTRGMKAIYRRVYRIPHVLVVHSHSTREGLMRDFGIDGGRIVLMEHGTNDVVGSAHEARDELRRRAGVPPEMPTLLFFGGIAPYKGLDLLLAVAERRDDFRLVVAGRCPDTAYGQAMRARLTQLRARGRLVWMDGYLDDADVARAFAMADATVLPYRHIDQSGVLFLALSQGVPLIATDVGGLGEHVTPETGVLFPTATEDALEQAIDRYLAQRASFDPAEIRRRAQRYEWRATVQPLLSTLSGVAA